MDRRSFEFGLELLHPLFGGREYLPDILDGFLALETGQVLDQLKLLLDLSPRHPREIRQATPRVGDPAAAAIDRCKATRVTAGPSVNHIQPETGDGSQSRICDTYA